MAHPQFSARDAGLKRLHLAVGGNNSIGFYSRNNYDAEGPDKAMLSNKYNIADNQYNELRTTVHQSFPHMSIVGDDFTVKTVAVMQKGDADELVATDQDNIHMEHPLVSFDNPVGKFVIVPCPLEDAQKFQLAYFDGTNPELTPTHGGRRFPHGFWPADKRLVFAAIPTYCPHQKGAHFYGDDWCANRPSGPIPEDPHEFEYNTFWKRCIVFVCTYQGGYSVENQLNNLIDAGLALDWLSFTGSVGSAAELVDKVNTPLRSVPLASTKYFSYYNKAQEVIYQFLLDRYYDLYGRSLMSSEGTKLFVLLEKQVTCEHCEGKYTVTEREMVYPVRPSWIDDMPPRLPGRFTPSVPYWFRKDG